MGWDGLNEGLGGFYIKIKKLCKKIFYICLANARQIYYLYIIKLIKSKKSKQNDHGNFIQIHCKNSRKAEHMGS